MSLQLHLNPKDYLHVSWKAFSRLLRFVTKKFSIAKPDSAWSFVWIAGCVREKTESNNRVYFVHGTLSRWASLQLRWPTHHYFMLLLLNHFWSLNIRVVLVVYSWKVLNCFFKLCLWCHWTNCRTHYLLHWAMRSILQWCKRRKDGGWQSVLFSLVAWGDGKLTRPIPSHYYIYFKHDCVDDRRPTKSSKNAFINC